MDEPRVSPLRLAVHLGLALLLFSFNLMAILEIAPRWCRYNAKVGADRP
jgi:hypothetical protein